MEGNVPFFGKEKIFLSGESSRTDLAVSNACASWPGLGGFVGSCFCDF